jgi:hypothetical protein
VGAESWADYCDSFLMSPPEAMDELIEGIRILVGQNPECGPISDEAARKAAAEKARHQAETISQGSRTDLQPPNDVKKSPAKGMDAGNSAAYLLRRIARTSPETLAAYEAGQYATVREEARQAGTIHVAGSPPRTDMTTRTPPATGSTRKRQL